MATPPAYPETNLREAGGVKRQYALNPKENSGIQKSINRVRNHGDNVRKHNVNSFEVVNCNCVAGARWLHLLVAILAQRAIIMHILMTEKCCLPPKILRATDSNRYGTRPGIAPALALCA